MAETHRMYIRTADPFKDAQAIHSIYAPMVRDSAVTMELEPPTVQEIRNRIATTLEKLPWLVYDKKGQVLGYAYASPHRTRKGYQWTAEISVYVSPSVHRQGIGKALYETMFEILIKQGYYTVLGGITIPNQACAQLHLSTGFEPVGIYKKASCKFGKWFDKMWFQKELCPREDQPPIPTAFPQLNF